MKFKLLLAEDDTDLGMLLKDFLERHHFETDWVKDGTAALDAAQQQTYHLVLLDVMMPGKDGFGVAAAIKRHHPLLPFLFITARKMKDDVLHGLKLGADDYIIKPFEPEELVLRITNILRRASPPAEQQQAAIPLGMYLFYPQDLLLTSKGSSVTLTEKEARLLLYLYEHKNGLIKRTDILQHLWPTADFFNGRSMDVFMTRLRKLLSAEAAIEIKSVRGIGYHIKMP